MTHSRSSRGVGEAEIWRQVGDQTDGKEGRSWVPWWGFDQRQMSCIGFSKDQSDCCVEERFEGSESRVGRPLGNCCRGRCRAAVLSLGCTLLSPRQLYKTEARVIKDESGGILSTGTSQNHPDDLMCSSNRLTVRVLRVLSSPTSLTWYLGNRNPQLTP